MRLVSHLSLDDPLRRAYLASSSRGDRSLLLRVSKRLSERGYMVFSPCLGFVGSETPQIRPDIMRVCEVIVIMWADILFILDEDIPSSGCDIERMIAESIGTPVERITSALADEID